MAHMKKFICDNINELSQKEREHVYNILTLKLDNSLINLNSDGVRIDLDKIDSFILNEIYEFIKEKIDNYKNNI